MAVYKRTYTAYEGGLTPAWSRFLILPRAAYKRLWQSRFLAMFFTACFFYPLGCAAFIYLSHNLSLLDTFNIPVGRLFAIDALFFQYFCAVQGAACYLLTAFIGPSLVSPDLVNNAIPLYLSRPFSRAEYVAGKMSVLMIVMAMISWIPGLILFLIQASLAGWQWTVDNLWIAGSLVVGLVVWNAVLSLIGLALSAWIKWRIAAGALVLGVFFAGAGFGTAVNLVMDTEWGTLLNLTEVIDTVWSQLFGYEPDAGITAASAWICLGVVSALCLWLLSRRVRGFEVVK